MVVVSHLKKKKILFESHRIASCDAVAVKVCSCCLLDIFTISKVTWVSSISSR